MDANSIAELITAIDRSRVERAREMCPVEKFLAGPRLFDFACGFTRAGIRNQNPTADEAEVTRILRERLALQRRIERLP